MRAVIVATGHSPTGPWLHDRHPLPLLPLGDRPLVQHLVESLVSQGVFVFDWVLGHRAEEVERFLGSGKRWGAEFRFHRVPDPSRPYGRLRALPPGPGEDGRTLLGHADRLPPARAAEARPPARGALLYGRRDEGWRWTGWAVLSPEAWAGLPRAEVDERGLCAHLRSAAGGRCRWEEAPQPAGVRNFWEFLEANGALLRGEFPGLLCNARPVGQDVWVSPRVRLHPSAVLVGPVLIGEDCEVAAGARVGPNAVVGAGCVIDRRASVANAVVLPHTYVGESLELDTAVVDRDWLAVARPGRPVRVEADWAVGGLEGPPLPRCAARLLSMATGPTLLLAAPVRLLVDLSRKLCGKGKVLHGPRAGRPTREGVPPGLQRA